MRSALRWHDRLKRGLTESDRERQVATARPEFDPDSEPSE
jgi:hypothetical protein